MKTQNDFSGIHFSCPFRITIISLLFSMALFGNSSYGQEITPSRCYGGNRMLRNFIAGEMHYPAAALQAHTEGEVQLSFVVNTDGSISCVKIVKSVSKDIDAEAIRILKKILWYPARDMGKPIAYEHSLKFVFRIKKYQKLVKKRGYDELTYPHQPYDTGNLVYTRKQIDEGAYPVISSLDKDFTGFLVHHLKYPETAFKQSISGTVKLRFVVEPSGRISNIEVLENLGGGCTEEAIRVLKLIRWFPALKSGRAVRSFIPMEVNFNVASKTVGGSIPTPGQLN